MWTQTQDKLAEAASLQDRIRLALEREIMSGERPPGSAIDDRELAARFGTSRTPVREVLLTLSVQGMVTIVPRSGIFVRQFNPGELIALVEALEEQEVVLARLAARRLTSAQRLTLRDIHEVAHRHALNDDLPGYSQANAELHGLIYDGSNNPILAEQARLSRKRFSAYRRCVFDVPGRLLDSSREHALIVDSLCRGDESAAADAMRAHIHLGGDALVSLLLRCARELAPPPEQGARRRTVRDAG